MFGVLVVRLDLSQGHGFESQNEHGPGRYRLKASRRETPARPAKYDLILRFAGRGVMLFVLLYVTPIRSVSYTGTFEIRC